MTKTLEVIPAGIPEPPLPGRDYNLRLPRPHLSYSQIDTYLRCPEQYRQKYILGLKSPYTVALFEGDCMDATMSAVGRRLMRGKGATLKWASALHVAYVGDHADEVEDWGDQDKCNVLARGAGFLAEFWRKELPALKPLGVQVEFTEEFAGVPVHGYIDLVERIYVWDYKVVGTSFFLKPDSSLQLMLYATVARKEKRGFIAFDKKAGQVRQLRVSFDLDLRVARRYLEFKIGNVAKGISLGVFPPRDASEGNNLCSRDFCPAWDGCAGQVVR